MGLQIMCFTVTEISRIFENFLSFCKSSQSVPKGSQNGPRVILRDQNNVLKSSLGGAVGFSTRAQGVGFYTTLQVYCNWFVSDFTLLSVSIYLF